MVRLLYIFKRIATGARLRPWGTLFTVVACWFAVCQLFLVFFAVIIAGRATLIPGTNTSVMAYLEDTQQLSVIQSMKEKIALIEGVSHVEFIPRSEGLLRMKQWLGSDNPWIEDLDADILPDAFEITIRPQFAGDIGSLTATLRTIPNIEDVHYNTGLVGSIAGAYHTIVAAAILIALIVIVCLSMVLFLSIRVGIMTRHNEIEVLNILGAERSFLYAPYIIEAACYGIISSLLALMSVHVSIGYIAARLPVLYGIISPLSIHQALAMTVFVCLFCVTGAALAIKRNADA